MGTPHPLLYTPLTLKSLVATLKKEVPELLPNVNATAEPIPDTMPTSFQNNNKKYHVEGIGEPVTACFMTRMNTDPTNW